jgi:predicted enzyme related to lactoylglutathione lyase
MQNAINWFEIPVRDLDRAVAFYEAVLGQKLRREVFGGKPMAIFPYGEGGVGGALMHEPKRAPSTDGALVYLHVGDRLEQALASAKRAHGEVVLPKTHIGDPGHIGIVRDTEGNLVGLHEPPAASASKPGAASAA